MATLPIAGNTVYWTAAGVTWTGIVKGTPLLTSAGLVKLDGGEPIYKVKNVSNPFTTFAASQTFSVRQAEIRLNP